MERTISPNTTQFPNVLTDQVMPLVSGNEWKVIHYGVRYALGHRSTDTLTIAQIARGRQAEDGTWLDRGTGLDENEVKECLAFLCEDVHIFLREDRPRKPHGYRLNSDLSSINWDELERRQSAAGQAPVLAAPVDSAPPVESPVPRRTRRDAVFVESPSPSVHLDGSDRPAIDQMHDQLSPDEGKALDHLLALAREKVRIAEDTDVGWSLYTLWRAYGFRRLQNALQSSVGACTLDELSQSCLVSAVVDMLEPEKFGPMTQMVRDRIVVLAEEFPSLAAWQDAISSAVMYSSRRLATVEKNLRRDSGQSVREPQGETTHARPTTPAQGRKRPARRQSEWSADELKAGRDADRGKEWTPPPE